MYTVAEPSAAEPRCAQAALLDRLEISRPLNRKTGGAVEAYSSSRKRTAEAAEPGANFVQYSSGGKRTRLLR